MYDLPLSQKINVTSCNCILPYLLPAMPRTRRHMLLFAAVCSTTPANAFVDGGFVQRVLKAPSNEASAAAASTSHGSVAAAAALIAGLLSLPPIASSADIARGKEIFDNNCAGCHVGGANLVKPEKDLHREALVRYVSADLSQAEVQQWVQQSGQHKRIVFFKMPDGKMKEADWADVTTYVLYQALNDKW